jgi:hypothetical protein
LARCCEQRAFFHSQKEQTMPAINMGAAGGSTAQVNAATAAAVLSSPFSGPTNSPLDARKITGWSNGMPTYANDATNYSTGGLNTGIGFGIGKRNIVGPTAPASIKAAGFSDDYTPGVTLPGGTSATDARLTAIGGGKEVITNGVPVNTPYAAQPLLGFGNGASRDAGAGPAFTGFGMKMVTASGTVAEGSAVETGFTNRAGRSVVTGESVFGSATAASPAVT